MKKYLSLFLMLTATLSMMGDITFMFTPNTISEGAIKGKMERNISALLTEIQRAGTQGDALDLTGLDMEQGAKERLNAFWENMPFLCEKRKNASDCLNDHQGYQVRGITITLYPKDDTYDGSLKRELTVSLDRRGVITGVRPALELQENVDLIMGQGHDVDDLTKRREILKWVEDFRNYYNERNLNSLKQIYSEDALIITGSIVKQRKTSGGVGGTVGGRSGDFHTQISSNVKYSVQTKAEYISRLEGIFNNNRIINVKFDKISVVRHGSKPYIYGVTLHQTWHTSRYHDEGWLFLLWDFHDPDHPQIHVRSWQPDQVVSSDGLISIYDFFIP